MRNRIIRSIVTHEKVESISKVKVATPKVLSEPKGDREEVLFSNKYIFEHKLLSHASNQPKASHN